MFKSVLICGLLGLSLLSLPIAANAQAQQLNAQTQTQSTASAEIPSLELQQFVQIIKRWKTIDQESQGKMVQIIKSEGLTPERFVEILKQQQSPKASDGELSADDKAKFEKIITKFQQVEQDSIPKKEKAITSQGLDVKRFAQIQQMIQQDPSLQQKVQKMMGEEQKKQKGQGQQ